MYILLVASPLMKYTFFPSHDEINFIFHLKNVNILYKDGASNQAYTV